MNVSPSGARATLRWNGVTGPVRPAHREMPGPRSTSRSPPTTDTAAHPSMATGRSVALMVATISSMAPA